MALLLADDHHGLPAKSTKSADNGLVIGELAVATKLDELLDQARHVVDEVRPVRMTGDLGLLPGV